MASGIAIRTVACFAVVATFACVSPSSAQSAARSGPTGQTPPRDSAGRAPTGTGVISGHVVAADGNRPLRRVQVRVAAPGDRPPTTSTDVTGEYEFTDLPPGRYAISATRGGFLTLSYGQRRPRELGKLVEVANGRTVNAIDFALPRMSVISGRVTDE